MPIGIIAKIYFELRLYKPNETIKSMGQSRMKSRKIMPSFLCSLLVHLGSLFKRELIILNSTVWPTGFLLNVFTALKETQFYIFIYWSDERLELFWKSINFLNFFNYKVPF